MGIVKVAGFWDLGWNTPIKEIELWEFPLRDFGVDEHYMLPISGIQHKVSERKSLDEILKDNPELTVVFCDEKGETNLSDFSHPDNVLYIFGKANYSPFLQQKRDQDLSINIETKNNEGMLWGHQAAAIILYDRMIKWQSR